MLRVKRPACFTALAALFAAAPLSALPTGTLFATRPAQVLALRDHTGDGDFFDFSEIAVYADSLPVGIAAAASLGDRLYVVNPAAAQVLVLRDANADGDALDFGEVLLFAQLPTATPVCISAADDGSLLVADATCNCLYRLRDTNDDGDALDAGEISSIAAGLTAPVAAAVRPDGKILVAQNNAAIPVRILHDRNGDDDFLDFAENISYVENTAAGSRIAVQSTAIAHLLRPADGRLLRLHDLTGDDDALDFGEVIEYATGFSNATALAGAGAGHFIADGGASGVIRWTFDENGDGDALDFGEARTVAEGVTQCQWLVFVPDEVPACVPGDADGDGQAAIADVPVFVSLLLTKTSPADPCPLDANDDGLIDGRDIQGFVNAIVD